MDTNVPLGKQVNLLKLERREAKHRQKLAPKRVKIIKPSKTIEEPNQ